MRVWFVGLLFSIGVFLILYCGLSLREKLFLTPAGVLGLCVAVFPMPWGRGNTCPAFDLHRIAAILFFACIAYVSIRCARETLYLIADEQLRARYRRNYRLIGLVMLSSPIRALLFSTLMGAVQKYVFVFEAAGIRAFACSWWTKSGELTRSGAELLALQGKLGE